MSMIRCLVVDDEPIGREIVESFVKKIGFLELVAVCEDAFEALEILESRQIDLLLSDIQMPEINGLEFVRSLPSPPVIIFITAHDQFAVNSYELGVADYLLKPVSFERFLKAINKARMQIEVQRQSASINENEEHGYFFIKSNNKLNKVFFKDIYYIESVGDYVKIFTSDATLINLNRLKIIEEQLPANQFIRTHNCFLISINAVKAIKGNTVELLNGTSVPVAVRRKPALFAALQIKEV